MARFPRAIADWSSRYNRAEKDTHRFAIADTRGRLVITIPIAKPGEPATRWADVRLSDHGRWQDTVPTALESAYGRTPFFEFYADRLLPIFANAGSNDRLLDFVRALDRQVLTILGLDPDMLVFAETPPEAGTPITPPRPAIEPYWQVRADSLGFIPSLSILDLIFSLGPDAPLALKNAKF